MKVAIDTGPLEGGNAVRGIGVHTRELLKAFQKLDLSDIKIDAVDFAKTDLAKYDLAHYPYFRPFFVTLPWNKKTKQVVTIHDLIPLIYPDAYPPGIKGWLRFQIQKYLVKKADAIITISETSKKDIVRFLGIPEQKIHVTYLAPQSGINRVTDKKILKETKEKYNLPDKFVLYVGDVNYNKNLITLVKACKKIKIPLVISGKQAASEDLDRENIENLAFWELIDKYGDDKDVLRIGFVDNLSALYSLASAYCQPSLYEGFGLTILEAMKVGVPVVAAKTQVLVEVGGNAALFADPKNYEDLAEKLKMVLKNPENAMEYIKKGKENCSKFSWKKTAEETLQVYREIFNK